MSDDLLHYYKIERSFVRKDADEFARAHPDVAERLRLGPDSADPHVERLIEAFAFLTARVHRKLDDDFPELTDALLNTLYPHYLRPVPSTAIVEFAPDPASAAVCVIDRGTQLVAERAPGSRGVQCAFRTTQEVALWPITVSAASLGPVEIDLPDYTPPASAQACLRIELSTLSKDIPFSKLGLRDLRLFLSGDRPLLLYELMLNNVVEVLVTDANSNPKQRRARRIQLPCINPGGFTEDEALLPSPNRSFPGYRLLSECFACPEKFLFVDIGGLDRFEPGDPSLGGKMVLNILLNRSPARELEREVNRQTFRHGCTPIINLFTHEADPIKLAHTQLEYLVTPDARSPGAFEVYSIDRVQATAAGAGDQVEYRPFFSPAHRLNGAGSPSGGASDRYWYSRVLPSRANDGTTDTFVAFIDLGFSPAIDDGETVRLTTTCFNRNHRLPFGGDQPRLRLAEGDAPVKGIRALTAPTAVRRPEQGRGAMWRIVSHLNLNHLSITGEDGAEALREILRLYDTLETEASRAKIAALQRVDCRRAVFPVPGERGAFCRGQEVTIDFDEDRFSDHGLFLFATVLERFLGLYCSINSAMQMVAQVDEPRRVLRRWPPRMGERVLL